MKNLEETVPGKRMLIVDDHCPTAMAYRTLFEVGPPPMVVDVALTAEAALLCIRHGPYDVILSDQQLGTLDGLGLLIASRVFHPGTPFILITGHGDRVLEEKASSLGVYAVLHKPVDVDVLVRTVRRACTFVMPRDDTSAHKSHQAPLMGQDDISLEYREINLRLQAIVAKWQDTS